MSRRSPTSVGQSVATPRVAPPRGLYTGAELLTPPVRPGAQDAYRLPSIVAGKPVTPAQLHADLLAPIVAAPPPMGRAASRVADPEPPQLPDPPASPPAVADLVQPPPKVTYTRIANAVAQVNTEPLRTSALDLSDALALTFADLARTLEDTAQLLRQAGRALLSNPHNIRGQ